jgi:hypothetical protein
MSKPQSLADQMHEIAQDAVRFAQVYIGADLDFSPESLDPVEAQLDSIARSLPKGFVRVLLRGRSAFANDVLRPTLLWGGYLGEVIRRRWGGEWRTDNTASDVDTYVLALEHGDIRPMDKVWKRLHHGPQNDIRQYYRSIAYICEHGKLPDDGSIIIRE